MRGMGPGSEGLQQHTGSGRALEQRLVSGKKVPGSGNSPCAEPSVRREGAGE